MRTTWTFHGPGTLLFGPHAVRQLPDLLDRLGARRVFIITDPALVKAGVAEQVHAPLSFSGEAVELFPGGEPEPSLAAALRCIDAARAFGPDAVIGLGGGSNMDLAKATALVLSHGGSLREHFGEDRVPGPLLPVLCLPTTAGTGSEVSGSFVLTDTDNHLKVGVLSNYLRPRVALVDPMLTVTCPRQVTADSGIDALTHAIEAFTAVDNADFALPQGERTIYQGRHPMGDMLAERAISLAGRYLRRAVADGHDLEAREGMALAATLAGLAFSNVGVALVHALEYPVGGAVHVSHGAGNGLLLPAVMRYNLSLRVQEFATVARLLGEDVQGLSDREAAERAVAAVERLRADIGIPQRLRDLGVRMDQLKGFAEKAIGIRRILRVNPRTPTVDDLEALYQEMF